MNLNSIASSAISPLHPIEEIELYTCAGQTTDDEGEITPSYSAGITLAAQVQSFGDSALKHEGLAGVNTQQLNIFIDGTAKGIDRVSRTGGDMIRARGRWWLVTAVPNDFTNVGWVQLRVTLQLAPPEGVTANV